MKFISQQVPENWYLPMGKGADEVPGENPYDDIKI